MPDPLYRVVVQKRTTEHRISVRVEYSPTLRYLPVPDRERTIYEASCEAHERAVEAFEAVA